MPIARLLLVSTILYFLNIGVSYAQKCSAEQIIKLSQSGFSKSEIKELCKANSLNTNDISSVILAISKYENYSEIRNFLKNRMNIHGNKKFLVGEWNSEATIYDDKSLYLGFQLSGPAKSGYIEGKFHNVLSDVGNGIKGFRMTRNDNIDAKVKRTSRSYSEKCRQDFFGSRFVNYKKNKIAISFQYDRGWNFVCKKRGTITDDRKKGTTIGIYIYYTH